MKKTFLLVVGACFLAVVFAGQAMASKSFAVSAVIPLSTTINYEVTEILANGTWTTNHPAGLNFGNLLYDTDNGIFTPARYFAIDMGVAGAGKPTNIQFAYTEGSNPNVTAANGLGGLGKKATLSLTKAVLDDADVLIAGPALISSASTLGTFTKSQFVGGWPRVYIGMWNGKDTLTHGAANAEVFTGDDAAGTYTGILQITATVL